MDEVKEVPPRVSQFIFLAAIEAAAVVTLVTLVVIAVLLGVTRLGPIILGVLGAGFFAGFFVYNSLLAITTAIKEK